ncbi:hypothetical protein BDA99DRAFT_533613 [Phascolomyces articulosus]|uniref:DNA replication regulator SLD2 n=1 Tax=Phascolomyces articulosus TaxID=60185 RepID=A0AAD5PHY9_9FUNG|nr:hypothetical protein BDA99DRAFT_533613 [Phascolomyces articulosus]
MADTDTVDYIKALQEKIASRKIKLLEWESDFKKRHLRRPTIQDVKNRPDVEVYYLKYNRLKKKLKEAQTTQPSPKRPVEFVHSPNHPRSPHNQLLRAQQQEQRSANEWRPRPLVIPQEVLLTAKNNRQAKKKNVLATAKATMKEGTEEGEATEELNEQAFWLDMSVPELLQNRQEDGDGENDDTEEKDEQKKTQDISTSTNTMITTPTTSTATADNLDDLFNDIPGNENWANSEELGPLAAYARQKQKASSNSSSATSSPSSSTSTSTSKRKGLGNEQLMEKRRKMKAMLEPYRPKSYDTLSTALAAERQAKRDRENEQQNEQKPLQLAAATTKTTGNVEGEDDFIVSRRVYAPVVKSRDTGLLRNNPERRARLREQLEAGTLGIPQPKSAPSTQDGDSTMISDDTPDDPSTTTTTTEMENETSTSTAVN